MPQASSELQQQMDKRFGNPISDAGPIKFLENAGYVLTKGWLWKPKPSVTVTSQMTKDEFDCLLFLIQEWDFGGLKT